MRVSAKASCTAGGQRHEPQTDGRVRRTNATAQSNLVTGRVATPGGRPTRRRRARSFVQPYLSGGANVHTHLVHDTLVSYRSLSPNGISIASVVFWDFQVVINRLNDRQNEHGTRSLAVYVRCGPITLATQYLLSPATDYDAIFIVTHTYVPSHITSHKRRHRDGTEKFG